MEKCNPLRWAGCAKEARSRNALRCAERKPDTHQHARIRFSRELNRMRMKWPFSVVHFSNILDKRVGSSIQYTGTAASETPGTSTAVQHRQQLAFEALPVCVCRSRTGRDVVAACRTRGRTYTCEMQSSCSGQRGHRHCALLHNHSGCMSVLCGLSEID